MAAAAPFSTEAVCSSFLDRLGRCRRGFLAAGWRFFLYRDFHTRLFGHLGREKRPGSKAGRQQHKAGTENGTHDFIEFEESIFGSGSKSGF